MPSKISSDSFSEWDKELDWTRVSVQYLRKGAWAGGRVWRDCVHRAEECPPLTFLSPEHHLVCVCEDNGERVASRKPSIPPSRVYSVFPIFPLHPYLVYDRDCSSCKWGFLFMWLLGNLQQNHRWHFFELEIPSPSSYSPTQICP